MHAAGEVCLSRHRYVVCAGVGLNVAFHVILLCGHCQFTCLHLSDVGGLWHRFEEVVVELCLFQCHGGERCRIYCVCLGLCTCVVTLTCSSNHSGAGIHVVGDVEGVVGAFNQCGGAVLHSYLGGLCCAVVCIYLLRQYYLEEVGVSGYYAELCSHGALVVALTIHCGGIDVNVLLCVAADVVAFCRHEYGACVNINHLCGLLLLVVYECCLSQRYRCQCSLLYGNLKALCCYVVVVSVSHYAVIHGIFLCVGTGGNAGAPCLVVQ